MTRGGVYRNRVYHHQLQSILFNCGVQGALPQARKGSMFATALFFVTVHCSLVSVASTTSTTLAVSSRAAVYVYRKQQQQQSALSAMHKVSSLKVKSYLFPSVSKCFDTPATTASVDLSSRLTHGSEESALGDGFQHCRLLGGSGLNGEVDWYPRRVPTQQNNKHI